MALSVSKRGKRGQEVFGMSFGVIFAIILIVAILAVGFYVISYFLNLQKCTETALLYNDLQAEVDNAWKSSIYQDIFEAKTPRGITYLCFGSLRADGGVDNSRKNEIIDYGDPLTDDNMFIYPPTKACSAELYSYKLSHVAIDGFFCVKSENGEANIKMSKGGFDSLVKIEK